MINPIVEFPNNLPIFGSHTLPRKCGCNQVRNMNYWIERKRWLEIFNQWASVNYPGWEDVVSQETKDKLEKYISQFDFGKLARYNSQEEACLFGGQSNPLHSNRPRLRFIGASLINREYHARCIDECDESNDG